MGTQKSGDLGEIAQRMNKKLADENFLKEFLNDPVSYLKNEGLKLSPDQEKIIVEAIGKIKPKEPIPKTKAYSPY